MRTVVYKDVVSKSGVRHRRPSISLDQYHEPDPVLSFLYKPHTVSALLLALVCLVYIVFTRVDTDSVNNVKMGLIAAAVFFMVYSAVHMPDGLFIRPHPVFWRIAMGSSVLYGCVLVFLLFQTPEDGRNMLSYVDPALGKELPERNYALDCRVYTPGDERGNFGNIRDTVYDEFVWAHLLGWFAKTLVYRDMYIVWVLSIFFEVLELSLAHILPNFHECWWDHIIVDILVCNLLGMLLGFLAIRLFRMKEYNFSGAPDEESAAESDRGRDRSPLLVAFLKATLQQFAPKTLVRYKWKFLASWRRCFYVIWLLIINAQVELNAFFLKALLWIPPPHPLNITRLVIWFFISLPAMREYHQFVSDPKTTRLGTMAWLGFGLTFTETALSVKWALADGLLENVEHPPMVVYGWTLFFIIFTIWAIWHYRLRLREPKKEKKSVTTWEPEEIPLHHPEAEEIPEEKPITSPTSSPAPRRRSIRLLSKKNM